MSELERQESETHLEPLEREWRSGKPNAHVFEDFHTKISKNLPFFSCFVASLALVLLWLSNTFEANTLVRHAVVLTVAMFSSY